MSHGESCAICPIYFNLHSRSTGSRRSPRSSVLVYLFLCTAVYFTAAKTHFDFRFSISVDFCLVKVNGLRPYPICKYIETLPSTLRRTGCGLYYAPTRASSEEHRSCADGRASTRATFTAGYGGCPGHSIGFSLRYQGELLGLWDPQNRDLRRKLPPETMFSVGLLSPPLG